MVYIGFDVGGTGVQVGVVNKEGQILCKGGIVTRTDIPFAEQIKAMADCALDTLNKSGYTLDDVAALGAGIPGVAHGVYHRFGAAAMGDAEHGVIRG